MTPYELAMIRDRAKHVGWVTESMNIHCRQDRIALLAYVDELLEQRIKTVAEMDQLRAQMAHAVKELQDDT